MSKYKIAIIGAGNMSKEHIKAFNSIDDFEIIGIYSRTKIKAEMLSVEFNIKNVCDSIDELYLKTEADLVIICVPELSTKDVCKVAFKFPWICLIEKPVGYNLSNAIEILNLAEKNNTKAYAALNRRHYSSTRSLQQDLKDNNEIRIVNVFDQENPQVSLEGGTPKLVVDNWMYANSIHIIDYFTLFCRGSLMNVINLEKWIPGKPCFVFSKLEYSSGDIGIYEAIWEGPGPWAVTVSTPSKRWELRPLEELRTQEYKSRKSILQDINILDTDFKPGIKLQAEETLKALKGEMNNLTTLKDALVTMDLINKIYER
jgi:NADH/NAD ratio-sensing transcriptional regulator Rex